MDAKGGEHMHTKIRTAFFLLLFTATFGIGYFYLELSDKLPSAFDVLNDGQGVEVFYNIEALPWLHVTPDFQYIKSSLQTNDDAYVFGIRTKVEF